MTAQVGDQLTGPWKGSWPLTAGKTYPSGGKHNAWDVGMPIGTPLYAARDGEVGARNGGVPNNRPGTNPGSNSPSNYVVLWLRDDSGAKAYLYYQHMSPEGVIAKGQVKAGQLLGYSGNSGNSSGPHLHIAGGTGWPPASDRYAYLNDPARLIYEPSKLFASPEEEISLSSVVLLKTGADVPIPVAPSWLTVSWESEHDPKGWHADPGAYPSISCKETGYADCYVRINPKGPVGGLIEAKIIRLADKSNAVWETVDAISWKNDGSLRYSWSPSFRCSKGYKYRLQLQAREGAALTLDYALWSWLGFPALRP